MYSDKLLRIERQYADAHGIGLPLTAEQLLNAVVEYVTQTGEDMSAEIATLQSNVANNKGDIDDLIQSVEIITNNETGLAAMVNRNRNDIVTLNNLTTENKTDIDLLDGRVEALETGGGGGGNIYAYEVDVIFSSYSTFRANFVIYSSTDYELTGNFITQIATLLGTSTTSGDTIRLSNNVQIYDTTSSTQYRIVPTEIVFANNSLKIPFIFFNYETTSFTFSYSTQQYISINNYDFSITKRLL